MGSKISCPTNFEEGPSLSCHVKCPEQFKYVQEGGGTSPYIETCVYMNDNNYSVKLRSLSKLDPSDQFTSEKTRVDSEINTLKTRITNEKPVEDAIGIYKTENSIRDTEVASLQSQYASYSTAKNVSNSIKNVSDKLRSIRPPTAPGNDIEEAKRDIVYSSAPNFLLLQIALFIIIVCMVSYLILPISFAHGISFLLLSVGIALGIFLMK